MTFFLLLQDLAVEIIGDIYNDGKGGWDYASTDGKAGWDTYGSGKAGW